MPICKIYLGYHATHADTFRRFVAPFRDAQMKFFATWELSQFPFLLVLHQSHGSSLVVMAWQSVMTATCFVLDPYQRRSTLLLISCISQSHRSINIGCQCRYKYDKGR